MQTCCVPTPDCTGACGLMVDDGCGGMYTCPDCPVDAGVPAP
jgi:hypothetical protein